MAEARLKSDWRRTAHAMCLTANINRGRGRRPYTPQDFMPFRSAKNRIALNRETIGALKVFVQ